jgi:glucokinase
VVALEEGLVAFERMLGEVHAKRDACHVRASAVQRDFFAQACTSSSKSKQLTNLSWTLEEHQILLSLQEVDLEVREVILTEELESDMHSSDR